MTGSASNSYMKMSQRRTKSPGWAAFDLKQKQGLEFEADNDPYPPMASSVAPLLRGQNLLKNNNALLVKPFSSVLLPSLNFPTLTVNKDLEKPLQFSNSSANQSNKLIEEKSKASDIVHGYEQLKELHSWADRSLIEDIILAVNNNFDEASTLLKAMVSDGIDKNNKETNMADLQHKSEDYFLDNKALIANDGVSLGETKDVEELGRLLENGLCYNKELIDDRASFGHMAQILGDSRFILIEPEWEEDDIYLIHRKDAVRMMRSASRHSKAANDAYLRGDHLSAQQFSLKAKEEWKAAERLNAKAAKEILSIRNGKNDMWTLDLHGLHASEAVQALQEHLRNVESQGAPNRSSSPNNLKSKGGIFRSASLESLNHMEKLGKQQALSRQRPTSLQVITGKGNHSRGQASLPIAIERFLSENRYHYDETRPGVILVRPKYRHPTSLARLD